MRTALAGVTTVALVAGCATTTDYLEYRHADRPQIVAARLLSAIEACWFSGDDAGFSTYRREAELQSHSNKPRILLVKVGEPGGLPQLIVEASRSGRRTSVKLFGPLLATPLGPKIRSDIGRWTKGNTACG